MQAPCSLDVGPNPFPRTDLTRSIVERFESQVRLHGARLAVATSHGAFDYAQLNALANAIAHAILDRELPAPSNVGLLLAHGALVPAAALATSKAGCTWVQLHPRHPHDRNAFVLRDADIRLVLADTQHAPQAHAIAARAPRPVPVVNVETTQRFASTNPGILPSPDAPALIKYTSGSTGQPKGVCLPPTAILHAAMVYASHGELRPDDRISGLSAGIGATELYGALLNGAALLPFDVQRDGPDRLADWVVRERITCLQAVPTVFRRLEQGLPRGRRLDDVRVVRLFGEPVTQSEWRLFRARARPDARLHVGLGSTETMAYRTGSFPRDAEPTDPVLPLDRAVADKHVELHGEDGSAVAPGDVGEVVVRSAFLFQGYWRRPGLTAAVLAPDPLDPRRRMFRTGDLGRLLPDGRFFHVGRADRQVKVAGNRIEPSEVEDALRRVPCVREAAVVAHRPGDGTVRLTAFCVADDASSATIDEHLRAWLPSHMIPASLVTVDALPSLASGKIDRAALVSRAEGARSSHTPPRNAIEETLVEIWRRALGADDVGVDDDLFRDLGGDSLAAVRILAEVGHVFRRELPLQVFHRATTVAQLAATLRAGVEATTGGRLVLHADGRHPPVFAICGAFGHALRLLLVGRGLGHAQPFVGLEPPGMDWHAAGCDTIESMGAHYAREIRALRAHGPYRLLGTSLGGLLAFEVATQLQRDGAVVDLLAMVDTALPTCAGPDGIEGVERREFSATGDTADRLVAQGAVVATQHRAALDGYVLRRRFDGRILYFRCTEPPVPPTTDRRRLWSRFATDGLRAIPVPGGHGQFHRDPQFSAVVAGLRRGLADVGAV